MLITEPLPEIGKKYEEVIAYNKTNVVDFFMIFVTIIIDLGDISFPLNFRPKSCVNYTYATKIWSSNVVSEM